MSNSALEKWATAVLAMVCVFLLANLVLRNSGRVRAAKIGSPAARPAPARHIALPPPGVKDELSRYDAQVRLKELAELQNRQLPEITRNPFEFPPPPKKITPPGTAASQTPPPPPPVLPLKYIGYTEKAQGLKEGVIQDDEDIYVVHEGENFARRYRVIKISPSSAEIADDTTRQTVQLPIAANQ